MSEYHISGGGVIVEDTSQRQYQVTGGGVVNEVTSGGPTIVEGTGAVTGTSTVSSTATALFSGVASSTGVGTPSGVSLARFASDGNVTSAATATGVSSTIISGVYGASGTAVVDGISEHVSNTIEADGVAAGVAVVSAFSSSIHQGVAASTGISTVGGISEKTAFGADGVSHGSAIANAISGVIAASVFNSAGMATTVNGVAPTPLTPGSFKPIEQRRVRLPKLPRGVEPTKWVDVSTREFDSFFNDMHYYLTANTFVSGVHSELLKDGFTLTPETSVVFLMSEEPVVSDPVTAIKAMSTIPRIFIVVNTGLFPITLKDSANTVFGGSDLTITSGRIILLVYTGEAWVGNAI